MYTEQVMEHFSNPKNVGVIEDADGIGEVGNPVCGDMMTVYIKVKDDKLADVKFKTFGCVAAIAVSSKVTEMARGKTITEAKAITKQAVAEALGGLPKEKMHCSNLGAAALAEAIKNYEGKKNGKSESHTVQAAEEKASEPMRCGCCDAENPVTAKFCMGCGEKLED